MASLTLKNSRWIRITTAAGLAPLTLARISIVLLCLPQTVKAGSEIRRELAWEDLPTVLHGEKVTVTLSEGGAVRGGVVVVQEDGVYLPKVTMATDGTRYPGGFDASVPRDSVKEIRVEKVLEDAAIGGAVVGAIAAFGLTGLTLLSAPWDPSLEWTTLLVSPVGGGFLGHRLGRRLGRKTTIITVR